MDLVPNVSDSAIGLPPIPDRCLYSALVDSAEDAILSLAGDGTITTANPAAEKMFESSRKELIGRSAFGLVSFNGDGTFPEKFRRAGGSATFQSHEAVRRKKDGSLVPVSLRISPIRDEFGAAVSFSWIVRDNSEWKSTEALLTKLSSVVEQMDDSVMITNRQGRLEYVNHAFEKITGYTKAEVLGMSANVLKSGKHSREFYKKMWETILAGSPFQARMINRRKNGRLYYSEKLVTPLSIDSKNISHFVSTDRDVTDRVIAEMHSAEVQKRFAELFNFSSDAMAYCALDGALIESNAAFTALTGYSKDELAHLKLNDITKTHCEKNPKDCIQEMMRTGGSCTCEREFVTKAGATISVLVTSFAVKNGDNDAVIAVGTILKDITMLKKQQSLLEQTARELERSNKDLEQFASVASHDLQEPLRTIAANLQLLERRNGPQLDADGKDFLRCTVEAARRSRDLITDLLTYARAGAKKAHYTTIDSREMTMKAVAALRQAIDESRAKIEVGALPPLQVEPIAFAQLMQNLLSNAIKYRGSEAPRIRVSAEPNPHGWTFSVEDNGIGIAPENTARVFAMFQRLHSHGKYPGTGIGLAICKKIVELRGGHIGVRSQLGAGSTFSFTVPDAIPAM